MNRGDLAARLLATFVGELDEQVQVMNTDLLALEAVPDDSNHLRSLLRVAHTLKGAARAAGVPVIERACHVMESLMSDARDGKRALGAEEFTLLFAAADALDDAGRRLKVGGDLAASPLAVLGERLQRASGMRGPVSPTRVPKHPVPLADEGAPESAARDRGDGQVRIDAEKLDLLLAATGQLLAIGSRVTTRPVELDAFHGSAARYASEWSRTGRTLRLALARSGAPSSLAHAVDRMEENFRRVVSEAARFAADATEDARVLSQAIDEVTDRARRLRMRPFADACEALPRAVRDLAATAAKEVDLEILGGDVEVDRAVLDGLRDALLHLVRNAVDHGIESPEHRRREGKPPRGKVCVAATLRGDRIVVTIADDGAGLDVRAVRTQLERRGLPDPGTERELARALFNSGLSTRTEISTISGRGVGLDIVRAAAERIRATIDVVWEPGRGTTFTLECPPTLATIRALLVMVGPQVVAIPTSHVDRLLRVSPDAIRYAEGRTVVATPETPVPLVALARLLPPLVERPATGSLSVLLLRAGDRRLAVAVDEFLTEQEVVLRPVRRSGNPLPLLSGAAILGPGQVALVLDPVAIVDAGLGRGAEAGITLSDTTLTAPSKRRILVVDDSITTRTLEQGLLEAAGYEVITAVDGVEGWRALQENGCDLVVADIEMPRMDGFALCEAIRGSKRFSALPVVLVTALELPEHRARGLEVGADAYIGKSGFDQQNLLDTISQLIGQVAS